MHQLVNIILAVLLFGFIIFSHELEHFLAAHLFNVGVGSFSPDMGPKAIAGKRGDAEYAIRAVPFGGSYTMQGEGEDKGKLRPGGSAAHTSWWRFFALIIGVYFNLLLALLLGPVLVMQTGVDEPYIGQLMPGIPAEEAGLKTGGRILTVNGNKAVFFRGVSMTLQLHAGESITSRCETPASGERTVTMTSKYLKEQDGCYTDVASAGSIPVKNPTKPVYYAAGEVGLNIHMTIQSMRMLIKGAVSPKNLTGPIGIVQAISEDMDTARPYRLRVILLSLFSFGLLLGANLKVMSLLPSLTPGDGKALLMAIEVVVQRPLNRKIEATVHLIGFIPSMGLMLYVLQDGIICIVQHTGFQGEKMRGRYKIRVVRADDVAIDGDHPIRIQSVCSTKTEDVKTTVAQIRAFTTAGCEIMRVAVPTITTAGALTEIRRQIRIPLIVDAHFDYRLTLTATEHGANKICISPDNINRDWKLREVVNAAGERNIPVRIGMNSDSLEKDLLQEYGGVTVEGIVEPTLEKVRRIEKLGYENLIISIKSSSVLMCIRVHELFAVETGCPLHIGITEAGTSLRGTVKSTIGLGVILYEGIGDTIRILLTEDPLEEIRAACEILRSFGFRKSSVEVTSCLACGRTEVDLIDLVNRVESPVERYNDLDVRTAVMGCVMNGPGEVWETNFSVTGDKGTGIPIRKGGMIRIVPGSRLPPALEAGLRCIRMERR